MQWNWTNEEINCCYAAWKYCVVSSFCCLDVLQSLSQDILNYGYICTDLVSNTIWCLPQKHDIECGSNLMQPQTQWVQLQLFKVLSDSVVWGEFKWCKLDVMPPCFQEVHASLKMHHSFLGECSETRVPSFIVFRSCATDLQSNKQMCSTTLFYES